MLRRRLFGGALAAMAVAFATPGLRHLDFTRLAGGKSTSFLQPAVDRAAARLVPFYPITPAERLKAFRELNFHPHGLYLPDDELARQSLVLKVREIGQVTEADRRLRAYLELQKQTEQWQAAGIPGHWNGQQAIARSNARFRIAAQGRRAGKTTEAAMEAIACAYVRPRSWVWLVGPTMKLADRAFEKVLTSIQDLGLETRSIKNSGQDKLIVLANGAKLEGISAENVWSMAGAAIDFAVIDEAAQIYPETWTRGVLPPLTDRNGQALLISSWEGEGDFFQKKAIEAEADRIMYGSEAAWELFRDASYDVNFYAFPQGERTPALEQAAKEMDPIEYLEQFGAIPATSRDRVFPEFKERVHVGTGDAYDYNSNLPVVLVADPSGGANPYAILAIQDYGDHVVIFDEFYESHMSTEEIAPVLAEKPWLHARKVNKETEPDRWQIDNCDDMIVDSASPEEIRRWTKMGFPAYAVPEKPEVPDRIPLMKNWLRDPTRFRFFYLKRQREVLEQMGRTEDDLVFMDREQRNALVIRIEMTLSDNEMDAATLRWLRSCAKVRVHQRCIHTIEEFKTYQFPKKRRLNMNYKEVPRDWMNHSMDGYGYYLWTKKRFADEEGQEGYDYSSFEVVPDEIPDDPTDPTVYREGVDKFLSSPSPAMTANDRAHLFTQQYRREIYTHPMAAVSYLEPAGRR